MNIYTNPNSSFPSQVVPDEEKSTMEYGLAVARAMMAKPKMLLLDEPSMGLAPQLVSEIFKIVKELNEKEGVSILLAEQNTNIALKNSDYGYIIETGNVKLHGTADMLLNNDEVKKWLLIL